MANSACQSSRRAPLAVPDFPMRRIVLVHTGALGYLIQALPAFTRIRAAFENARLVLLTGAPFAGVAETWSIFDRVLAIDIESAFHGTLRERIRVAIATAAALRGERPDAIGVFKAAAAYAALAWMSGAKVRVGLVRGSGAHLYTSSIHIRADQHREDWFLAVANALGASSAAAFSTEWGNGDSGLIAPLGTETRKLIAVAPGGGRNAKEDMPERRWPADRYLALIERLLSSRPEADIVLLGHGKDSREASMIESVLSSSRVRNLVGRTSLAAARQVLDSAAVFGGNDSALLHLAGTTRVPIVAVFGPTDPRVVAPRRDRVSTVWQPVGGRSCYDQVRGTLPACRVPCCIERVSVEEVLSAVLLQLEGTIASGPAGEPSVASLRHA